MSVETLLMIIIALIVFIGMAAAGYVMTRTAVHLERRISALEQSQEQKRWSHDQLEFLETIQFTLGRYLAERKIGDEIIGNVVARLGQLNADGPNGKTKAGYQRDKKNRQ